MSSARRIFALLFVLAGLTAGRTAADPHGPMLVLDGASQASPAAPVVVPLGFANNGHAITAIAFSLDLDTERLAFDPIDADMNGVPDAVTLPAGSPSVAIIEYDPDDPDGEIDILLANLSGAPLAEGVILEFELLPSHSGTVVSWITFSSDPPASFGNGQGEDIEGTTEVLGGSVFADGFESGDTRAWSGSEP